MWVGLLGGVLNQNGLGCVQSCLYPIIILYLISNSVRNGLQHSGRFCQDVQSVIMTTKVKPLCKHLLQRLAKQGPQDRSEQNMK